MENLRFYHTMVFLKIISFLVSVSNKIKGGGKNCHQDLKKPLECKDF